jgi:hypothetical protein
MRYRKLLLFAALLFCCGKATAQDKLKKLDTWLADNAEILGGRDMLLIYKDGKTPIRKIRCSPARKCCKVILPAKKVKL